MNNKIILLTPEELKEIILEALIEHDKIKSEKESETRLFSINRVSKILRVSHTTVKKLVENGTIKTTVDNKIKSCLFHVPKLSDFY